MTPQDLFTAQTALNALQEVEAAFGRNVATSTGFYLLAIGWLVTQESARTFLGKGPRIVFMGQLVVLVTTIAQCGIQYDHWARSGQAFAAIAELQRTFSSVFPAGAVDQYRISFPWHVLPSMCVSSVLAFALVSLLQSCTSEEHGALGLLRRVRSWFRGAGAAPVADNKQPMVPSG